MILLLSFQGYKTNRFKYVTTISTFHYNFGWSVSLECVFILLGANNHQYRLSERFSDPENAFWDLHGKKVFLYSSPCPILQLYSYNMLYYKYRYHIPPSWNYFWKRIISYQKITKYYRIYLSNTLVHFPNLPWINHIALIN